MALAEAQLGGVGEYAVGNPEGMAGGPPVAMALHAQDPVHPSAPDRRPGRQARAVNVVPEDIVVVGVDSEHTVAVKMCAVFFSVSVALDDGEASRRPGESDFRLC